MILICHQRQLHASGAQENKLKEGRSQALNLEFHDLRTRYRQNSGDSIRISVNEYTVPEMTK